MRRSRVAGAALGFMLALGSVALAGFITYPKTWGFGEKLGSADLNTDFAAVAGVVNGGLDDSNLSATAGIRGSKLADSPNGVPATKINSGAITDAQINATAAIAGSKLAVGASTRSFVTAFNALGLLFSTVETTLVTLPSFTPRGGRVLITGTVPVTVLENPGAICEIAIRLYSNTNGAGYVSIQEWRYGLLNGTGAAVTGALPSPTASSVPTANVTQVYQLRAVSSSANCSLGTNASFPGTFFAIEFA